MMFGFLSRDKALIDNDTRAWLFDTFDWAIRNFDGQAMWQETQLVLPTNEFYPGRVASVAQMADSIFRHSVIYAGMKSWPLQLTERHQYQPQAIPEFTIEGGLRGANVVIAQNENRPLTIVYSAQQINQPQDMIASYVQQLAFGLIQQQKVLPPGGKECIAQAIEVLACVMGFGVIFANTAYQFKGGCGSCYNPQANRQAALPENDSLYCLALFSYLKSIPVKQVTRHLKPHLRVNYKCMVKELTQTLSGSNSYQFLTLQ
ncbi:hypothetical protein tinsulaeT_37860 [Thalassotalea insulae]|uniref:Uncharacterized protein n=1 Tax=Thalassotalea insulae TaxID=2056778 RepID=A0ABQ6H0P5_9GAMM|nr:hypothetical protein [Thalassotalea insulae]GLX80446.1 hypothetical protein tinsulaeT_37860 [Thalassotalea insulae]